MNLSALQDKLYDWANQYGGLPSGRVSWLDQDAPKQTKPFIGLKIIVGPKKTAAFDHVRWDKPNVQARLSGLRRLTISVNVYAVNALQVASNLADSLDEPAVQDLFFSAGFSVVSNTEVRNLTQLLDTKSEERGQFDMVLLAASNRLINLEAIEEAEITGTLEGQSEFPVTVAVDDDP